MQNLNKKTEEEIILKFLSFRCHFFEKIVYKINLDKIVYKFSLF